MPTAHHMEVEMEDCLPAVPSRIRHASKAGLRKSFLLRNPGAGEQKSTEQDQISLVHLLHRGHVPLRNDQGMDGSLRIDVVKRQSVLVLIDNLGRDTSFDDPAEDTLAHATLLCLLLRPEPGPAEPLAQLLVNLLESHIVIAEDHERVEKQIGDFVDNFFFLAAFRRQ